MRRRSPPNAPVQRRAAQRTVRCNPLLAVRAPVVHGDCAVAERRRRDQLEPSRAGQPALVQGRAVAGDPGVDEELVLVDQVQSVQLGRELAAAGDGTHLYVCGPKGFMDHVLSTARAQGWPEDRLHYEFFGTVVVKTDQDQSFRVKLASSGRIILVPKEKTVVQALVAAGVEVPTSCEQGVCGTCLTRVLEGEPDHKDFYLTPAEQAANDQFMPCCSRSKSPMLVLEL